MKLAMFLCFYLVVSAQTENARIRVDVEKFRYPRLAEMARIRGDVIFEVSATGKKMLTSSHALLMQAAEPNLATWNLPPLDGGKYVVTYHFDESEQPATRPEIVPIGNTFERFFLRLRRAPTKKVVERCYYDPASNPATVYTLRKEGGDYIIDVFVMGRPACLNTQTSELARNSNL
jgi:hypothetical protein